LVPDTAEPIALLHREYLVFHQVSWWEKDALARFPNQRILRLALQRSREGRLLALYIPHGYNPAMIIGDRLRALREDKKLSQGDVEKRTGLLRCYISRVENGHTVPAIETLEKMARALEIPIYQLFYDGDEPPQVPTLLKRRSADDNLWGGSGKDERFVRKLRHLLGKSDEDHRKLLLHMAQKMARR